MHTCTIIFWHFDGWFFKIKIYEKRNIQVEQQVRCILYTVGLNKADTFCMFYFTVGILVKIAATFIDLKKGFELINLFFLYHTIFFSLQGNKAFCDLHVWELPMSCMFSKFRKKDKLHTKSGKTRKGILVILELHVLTHKMYCTFVINAHYNKIFMIILFISFQIIPPPQQKIF